MPWIWVKSDSDVAFAGTGWRTCYHWQGRNPPCTEARIFDVVPQLVGSKPELGLKTDGGSRGFLGGGLGFGDARHSGEGNNDG